MNRTEEILIMRQVLNLLRDLQRLLKKRYFDEFQDLNEKKRERIFEDEWLFPEFRDSL